MADSQFLLRDSAGFHSNSTVYGLDSSSPSRTKAPDEDHDVDAAELAALGYKQELYRGFGALMNFSFAFTAVAVISSLTLGLSASLGTGGPAVLVWTWIIASFATIIIGLSMAEICSTYPSAGSVYHWAGMMAPESQAAFWSYVDGWFNFLGNAAGDAAYAWGFANVLTAIIDLADLNNKKLLVEALNPNQQIFQNLISTVDERPHHLSLELQVIISIAIALLWAYKNTSKIDDQGIFNNISALIQMLSAVIFIVVLFICTPSSSRAPANWVFGDFEDFNGFPSNHQPPYSCVSGNFNDVAYLCFIGLLNSLFSFSGYEGGAHMAEETRGASASAPRSLLLTVICTAITGFLFLMAVLFSMYSPSLSYFISPSSPFSNPVVGVFYTSTGFIGGMILSILLLSNMFFAGFSSLTVTSRIGFAMARDGAFPSSTWLRVINPKSFAPVNMIIVVFLLDAFFCCFPLFTAKTPNPTLAFTAVTSITVIGYQISYAIPIILRATALRNSFKHGAFHLGSWGVPCATFSGIWLVVTSLIFFWPNAWPVTQYNMNYTVVVVCGVMFVAGVNWIVSARFYFTGPKRGANDIY